jgi:hypothetical protein
MNLGFGRDACVGTLLMVGQLVGCSAGTVASQAPLSVAIVSPAEGERLSGSIAVTGTAAGGVRLVEVGVDAGAFAAAQGTTAWSYTLDTANLAAGAHRIMARATDSGGHTVGQVVHVVVDGAAGTADTTPPTVVITNPADGGTVFGTATVTGTATDNVDVAWVEVRVDAGTYNRASGTAIWSYPLDTSPLTNGAHTLAARASDGSGNVSADVTRAFLVDQGATDTTKPVVTITSPTSGATLTGVATVTGTALDNISVAKVEVRVDAGAYASATGTTSWTYSLNAAPLADGTHTLTVRTTDTSGNVSDEVSCPFTISHTSADTTKPVVTITIPGSGLTVGGVLSVTGTASDNVSVATVQVKIDGGDYANATGTTSWTYTLDTTTLGAGTHTVTARATDGSANTSDEVSHSFAVDQSVPTFPIAVWLQNPIRERNGQNNAKNYKDIGVNIFAGLWHWPDEVGMFAGWATAAPQALKDVGLTTYAGSYDNGAAAWMAAHPAYASTVVGYLLGDEPDMNKVNVSPDGAGGTYCGYSCDTSLASHCDFNDPMMPDGWKANGDGMRVADPSRGLYGNFGKGFGMPDWPGYHTCPGPTMADDFAKFVEPLTVTSSDFYGITDPYEQLQNHGVWTYGRAVTHTRSYAGGRPVWGFLEGSNPWNNSGATQANQVAGRMPTNLLMPVAWNMVVHGANGLIYFCHDFSNGGIIEDGCLNEPGIPAAMQAVNASVQQYAAVLAQASVAGTTATSSPVAVTTLTKHYGGQTYVFAMGDGDSGHILGAAVTGAQISVAGASSGSVEVIGESRSVTMTSGSFSDNFAAYELHIYRF